MFKKVLTISLFSLSLSSCLFDRTTVESTASSLAGGGSTDMSLYVKFSDMTACTNGAVLTYNGGTSFSCVSAGVMTQTNITSGGASYVVTGSQNSVMLTYNDSTDGEISLPSVASVSDGFTVTVARQVAHRVSIKPNGTDRFQNRKKEFNMSASNASAVTITLVQGMWQTVHQAEDCTVGQSCWKTGNIYVGTLNGYQIFTTPGGCTDSPTPTCTGGDDNVLKMWANGSGTTANGVPTGLFDTNDGQAQSALLATTYTDTDAAQYCENMVFATYSDWYLPSKMELDFLYRNKINIGGMTDDWNNGYHYWSSTEKNDFNAFHFDMERGYFKSDAGKGNPFLVRCIRKI